MDMFSTHHTCHGKKYIALFVYSDTEPGSQMARAPTRRAETVGAPECSIPLKIWLEVTVLKGHCHGYLKCMQDTSGLRNFSKSLVCVKIFQKRMDLNRKRFREFVHVQQKVQVLEFFNFSC